MNWYEGAKKEKNCPLSSVHLILQIAKKGIENLCNWPSKSEVERHGLNLEEEK